MAKKCGLSVSTVSKVFNNYSDISESTRKKVSKTASQMGYQPNYMARALKSHKIYNLGVLFIDVNHNGLTHHFFSSILNNFKQEAENNGYDITFICSNLGRKKMTFLEHCRYRKVDGVCLACLDFYSQEVIDLVSSEIPCVTIDYAFNNKTAIMSENLKGMTELVKLAYKRGHRKIAYVHGQTTSVTELRLTGFYMALKELGIQVNPDYLVPAIYDSPESGKNGLRKLLSLKEPPTCIFFPDDYTALGAIFEAKEMGLIIPNDISIAGYDGISITQLLSPKLTTIKQDTYHIGKYAAQELINRIENPLTAVAKQVLVSGELLSGESIGNI